MGKRITWFDMISPKERKRQEEDYNHKIFPFGLAQRDTELELLECLIPDKKPTDSLYQTVLLKEIFLESSFQKGEETFAAVIADERIIEDLKEWEKNKLVQKYTAIEQNLLKAFAWKCLHICGLRDFPKATDVFEWINTKEN